jgi:hypothetical protein
MSFALVCLVKNIKTVVLLILKNMGVLALQRETATIKLDLVVATPADLKEIASYKMVGNEDFIPVYKIRQNLPYWLKSFKTDKIEPACYFLQDHTNIKDLKIFLDDNRVFIHKRFLKIEG